MEWLFVHCSQIKFSGILVTKETLRKPLSAYFKSANQSYRRWSDCFFVSTNCVKFKLLFEQYVWRKIRPNIGVFCALISWLNSVWEILQGKTRWYSMLVVLARGLKGLLNNFCFILCYIYQLYQSQYNLLLNNSIFPTFFCFLWNDQILKVQRLLVISCSCTLVCHS